MNETDGAAVALRERRRDAFLARHGWAQAAGEALVADASARRYLRLRRGDGARRLLMDAPPAAESVAAFVAVSEHLARLGVRVPAVYEADVAHGFLLLEDLGDATFARLLGDGGDGGGAAIGEITATEPAATVATKSTAETRESADGGDGREAATTATKPTAPPTETTLYHLAIDTLAHLHRHRSATDIDLPPYNAERALAEANLLVDWYLPARHRHPTPPAARTQFGRIWRALLAELPPLAPALVLRDYHIDNLMLTNGECALLDYQDAVIGSPAYDLISLLEDARRDLPPPLQDELLRRYLALNPAIDPQHLRHHAAVWGAQRHCKVAGIFVRLWLRDAKPGYLRHLPRVLAHLRRSVATPPLAPLREWLDTHLGEIAHTPFPPPRE